MSRPVALLVVATLASYACGGNTASGGHSGDGGGGTDSSAGDSSGSDGGDGGNESGGACFIDPAGTTFTFHLHNGGTTAMQLSYGCGGSIPVVLVTPGGSLGIGPGPADACELTCETQYKGPVQQGCSDCGPGEGAALPAGGTVDIAWDRRVYIPHVADPQCVGGMTGVSCALAKAVTATTMQQGTVTLCTGALTGGGCASSSGSSGGGSTKAVAFTVDTTMAAATIEVQ